MSLNNLINENLLILDLDCTDKLEILQTLVNLLDKEGVLYDKEEFLHCVLEREKISPTGLEDGLAIPHGKSKYVKSPKIAIARLKNPISNWESVDEDNKVNLVFLIAIPDNEKGNTHIEVLSNITNLFMEENFAKQLQEAPNKEKFLKEIFREDVIEEINEDVQKDYNPEPGNSSNITGHLNKIKEHLLFGTSHMIPFIVAGGVLLSLAVMISGKGAVPESGYLKDVATMGIAGLTLFTAVLGGYISYSIADKPGLAPGMIGSWIAVQNYKTGFIGAIIVGFLAGFIINLLKKIKLPDSMKSLGSIFIYPLIGTFIVCSIVMWGIGAPIAAIMDNLNLWLASMADGGKIMLGAILGGMTAFDMGGPINKVATLFAQTQVDTQPWLMGGVGIAICTPPLGMALATVLAPKKYTREEREAGKAAGIMGLIGISEGAIPFAAGDPLKVIPAIVAGGIVGNIAGFLMNCINHAPWGGWIVLPVVENKIGYIIGTILGALTTALIVNFLKKEAIEMEDLKHSNITYESITDEGIAEVLAITACPSGVAHTFLAAKALEKAAGKNNIKIKVETQGANGIVNRITPKDVKNAKFIILAHDVAIKNSERFTNIKIIDVKTKEAIKNPEDLILKNL
ncbi:PTS system IIA component, Fru family (TC 4.A.2)/PTS system IIB component, Fru family (TC 4.A.2)/PTS system IIC component, Fru family (TC 4.A.2) [Cetobacterium ceti]|uniref:PTS system IIA component, Fru family (TC 4.A.2)/PTS system IIB component, Fru family (TC 4.A.2)/PTS system IIC component, Fru family (TC 4.A.2) n=1 Tax=Cetobacterium ceti TaxID=180163 RepID=A0A1T4K7H1_9FUSO|nr:PTS fructose transporter subunit EIIC [Cetobacterium ceti]SJZ38356.1 PTS system IIA component, Fru family (TC 4.A.2)/PTS system IIB component, Fru family (TC 4.A.2)/PTS system IIC component, Fru family (TC 4.A.2) [Cetobacterium ceti]